MASDLVAPCLVWIEESHTRQGHTDHEHGGPKGENGDDLTLPIQFVRNSASTSVSTGNSNTLRTEYGTGSLMYLDLVTEDFPSGGARFSSAQALSKVPYLGRWFDGRKWCICPCRQPKDKPGTERA